MCFSEDSRYLCVLEKTSLRVLVMEIMSGRQVKEYQIKYKTVTTIEMDPSTNRGFLSTEGEVVYMEF